jgi:hypothetical protein
MSITLWSLAKHVIKDIVEWVCLKYTTKVLSKSRKIEFTRKDEEKKEK